LSIFRYLLNAEHSDVHIRSVVRRQGRSALRPISLSRTYPALACNLVYKITHVHCMLKISVGYRL